MIVHLLITLLFVTTVLCIPSLSISSDGDYIRKHKDDNLGAHHNAKYASAHGADGFRSGAEDSYSKQRESGGYAAIDEDKNHHLDTGNYADQNFNKHEGGSHANAASKSSQRKGHHNSGFHNTYHKDESSNKSSYYDENDEEGGNEHEKSHSGAHGVLKTSDDERGHYDDSYKQRENYEKNKHAAGRRRLKSAEDNVNYNHDKVYADNDHFDKVRDGTHDRVSSDYYRDKHYHPGHGHRVLYDTFDHPDKSTITIYEDPHVHPDRLHHERHHRDGHDLDDVHLRVVPSHARFDYDDY
ncbi:hypothetical protein PPYR_06951 [Photinus pyralis]|uniref:Uncharacterized protein n=2 Tax=Photinus pyralis TaxID=7054 RepID=A0A5N4AP39_PHOPY|nr:histidine-rich glycoprotein-like [Photinus pyralis]XP_031340530.1 histidine-rich glycoprotein-like [Photinus pyralis]KAB0799071.1 hypothetical protein PPYR_06951 [Photinus pyralis]